MPWAGIGHTAKPAQLRPIHRRPIKTLAIFPPLPPSPCRLPPPAPAASSLSLSRRRLPLSSSSLPQPPPSLPSLPSPPSPDGGTGAWTPERARGRTAGSTAASSTPAAVHRPRAPSGGMASSYLPGAASSSLPGAATSSLPGADSSSLPGAAEIQRRRQGRGGGGSGRRPELAARRRPGVRRPRSRGAAAEVRRRGDGRSWRRRPEQGSSGGPIAFFYFLYFYFAVGQTSTRQTFCRVPHKGHTAKTTFADACLPCGLCRVLHTAKLCRVENGLCRVQLAHGKLRVSRSDSYCLESDI